MASSRKERRKGFAEEAVREIINGLLQRKKIKEITANCLTSNSSSINLLNKLISLRYPLKNEMIY
jgi:ribosomal-protein-alanine N-acetyltransferase